ncbi:MAG: hypothetical protein Q9195_004104 [Heterodermia aff. obscurata]
MARKSERHITTYRPEEQLDVNQWSPYSTEAGEANVVPRSNAAPRWQKTPERMTAPFRSKRPTFKPNDFTVNEKQERLDKVYVEVLGTNGDKVLTEEVRWLAVTHKSFDHGRRGYNDRLAFLGKRIVDLQSSLAILTTAPNKPSTPPRPDPYGRIPFQHPALENLESLTEKSKSMLMRPERMAMLAEEYGLHTVVRWKPKNIRNMKGSGQPLVMCQAMYAIVGAVALQRGGKFANDVVRERILDRL